MKAAVIQGTGTLVYTDIANPEIPKQDEVMVRVKTVAMKHLDRSRASGTHYSSETTGVPKVIGSDGVGILTDGSRVYGIGLDGTMAEQALFRKDWCVPVPDTLNDAIAAALPNAVMGSAMALRFRAGLQLGETVLINGATGFTGQVAVQLARHYGAGKIIVTGRNETALKSLLELGADETISLAQTGEVITSRLKAIHKASPINVILDYLWGKPAELILAALKGKGTFTPNTRYISIGAMAGEHIQLSAEILRSVDLQLSGSGLGSWTKVQIGLLFSDILPEAFKLAAAGKLTIAVHAVPLSDVASLWDMELNKGKRPVIMVG